VAANRRADRVCPLGDLYDQSVSGRAETLLSKARARTLGRPKRPGSPKVFFVVGRARSGTSWVMRTLDAHPEILCRGEGRFFGRGSFRAGGGSATIPPVPLAETLASPEIRAWVERSVWSRDDDADRHIASLTRLATDYFLTEKLRASGKRIVGDKTPFLTDGTIAEIAEIHPTARVVHVIRDGRDVAISARHHVWNQAREEGGIHDLSDEDRETRAAYRADREAFLRAGCSIFTAPWLSGTAEQWARMIRRAREDGRSLLGERYLELRFEDLLEHPEREVGRMLRFLGASAGKETAAACVETASFPAWAGGRSRGEEDPRAFLRRGTAGEWREVFTAEDRQVFKDAAGDDLIELGYETSLEW